LDGPKIFAQKSPSRSGLKVSVVDGLRLLDLAVRPLADLLRRGQRDLDGEKESGSFGFSKN